MSDDSMHGDLKLLLGELKGDIKALHGRLDKFEATLADISKVVNMGKGAGWMLVRVGVFAAALVGGLVWLYEKVK